MTMRSFVKCYKRVGQSILSLVVYVLMLVAVVTFCDVPELIVIVLFGIAGGMVFVSYSTFIRCWTCRVKYIGKDGKDCGVTS